MKDNIKIIQKSEHQTITLQLALHSLSEGDDSIINFYPTVQKLRGIFGKQGEEILKQELAEKYDDIMTSYTQAIQCIGIIKAYKEGIDKNVIDKEDITSKRFQTYLRASASLPLVQKNLYQIFAILLRHSSIANLPIPTTHFTMVMPKERKLEELKQKHQQKTVIREETA